MSLLLRVGMKMGLDLRPLLVVTADEQLVEAVALVAFLEVVGNCLEMLCNFVQDAALGVSGIVAGKAVAFAMAREFVEEIHLLGNFAVGKLEYAGFGAIGENDQRLAALAQQGGQRLQMESLIEDHLRPGEMRREVELAPEVLSGAGKYGLGFAAVAAQAPRPAR